MKRFVLATVFCVVLAGCAHSPAPLPEAPPEEHQCGSWCFGVSQKSPEEMQAWKNTWETPAEWSEEDLKERMEWAEKSGGWRECREVSTYYMRKENYEEQKHWLIEARKKCEAWPCEDSRKKLIRSIDGWIAEVEKSIARYNMTEDEVLEKYARAAANEDLRSAEDLYTWYHLHHQFNQAIYWSREVRDLMIQRAGYFELAQLQMRPWFDSQQKKLLERAANECAHPVAQPPEPVSQEHQHHSGCLGMRQMSVEEMRAWKDPAEWSEGELQERMEWAEKSGGWRECREVSTYYLRKEEYEEAKHWLNEARQRAEALPCENMRKRVIQSIDGWIASAETRIAFYNMSEEEVLKKNLQLAEGGDWRNTYNLYEYYKRHRQFDQAADWLEKSRDIMVSGIRKEETRGTVLKMYDELQNRLSKKAEQERAGGDKKTDQ